MLYSIMYVHTARPVVGRGMPMSDVIGPFQWDNFTLPELNNFLMMLNKEEEDYKRRVRQKYTEMKRRIAEQMDQLRPADSRPAAPGSCAE